MSFYKVKGGIPLKGSIPISGAKNSSMPILIASLLSNEPVKISNVPFVSDVANLLNIMKKIGSKFTFVGDYHVKQTIELTNDNITSDLSNIDKTSLIRTSTLLMGPLLGKTGSVCISYPGGCSIGDRKIDMHIMAMKKLGATVVEYEDRIEATTNGKRLHGAEITFHTVSVGATENAIMAAVLADGETILNNVATEPEIDDLILFLNKIGAKISKTGERTLIIKGVESLHGGEHAIIPDRIEAGTYAILAAMTNGEIILHDVTVKSFDNLIGVFNEIGVECETYFYVNYFGKKVECIKCYRSKSGLMPAEIETNPYPCFATDLQPQVLSLLCMADGVSTVRENIFENRLQHVAELNKMGAKIKINGNQAVVNGKVCFEGADVYGTDLRAGIALLCAALTCQSETKVFGTSFIKRGYADILRNLSSCGGMIEYFQ